MPQHVGMQRKRHKGNNVRIPHSGECGAGHIPAIGGRDNISAQVWCIKQDGAELVRDRNDPVRSFCFEIIYGILLIVQKGHSTPDGQRVALNLAIPLNMEAKNAGSPRKFNDLRFIPISPGYGFLVRDRKHPQKAPGRKKQEKHDAKKHPSGGEEDPRPNEDYEWMYICPMQSLPGQQRAPMCLRS